MKVLAMPLRECEGLEFSFSTVTSDNRFVGCLSSGIKVIDSRLNSGLLFYRQLVPEIRLFLLFFDFTQQSLVLKLQQPFNQDQFFRRNIHCQLVFNLFKNTFFWRNGYTAIVAIWSILVPSCAPPPHQIQFSEANLLAQSQFTGNPNTHSPCPRSLQSGAKWF